MHRLLLNTVFMAVLMAGLVPATAPSVVLADADPDPGGAVDGPIDGAVDVAEDGDGLDPMDDQAAVRTAAQKRMEAIAGELRQIAERHGPDAVVFQTKLLINSLTAQPLGATEVRVAGETLATADGALDYLRFEVETGLVFEAGATTPSQRLGRIWNSLVLPVLTGMGSFKLEPKNLEIELGFGVQDIETLGLGELDPKEPMAEESVSFRIPADLLDDLIYKMVADDAVFARCEGRYGERRIDAIDAFPAPVPEL